MREIRLLSCAVFLLMFVGLGCAHSAREFIESQTQVKLPDSFVVCADGVVHDNESCRPIGGVDWVWNTSISANMEQGALTNEEIKSVIRRYYLGSLYYDRNLHNECKKDSTATDAIRVALSGMSIMDFATVLRDEAVDEAVANFRTKLKSRNINMTAEIEATFSSVLRERVSRNAQIKVVWFIMRITVGVGGIINNPKLKECVDDYSMAYQSGMAPRFITGVAGFVVMSNVVNVSVADGSVIEDAVRAAFKGSSPSVLSGLNDVEAELSVAWRKKFESTANVKIGRTSVDAIMYPLWVQFESLPNSRIRSIP